MSEKFHKFIGLFILLACVYLLLNLSELFPSLALAAESGSRRAESGVVFVFLFPAISIAFFIMPSWLFNRFFPHLSIFSDSYNSSFSMQYVFGYFSIFIFIVLLLVFSTLNG